MCVSSDWKNQCNESLKCNYLFAKLENKKHINIIFFIKNILFIRNIYFTLKIGRGYFAEKSFIWNKE